jgi:hypothetical protein
MTLLKEFEWQERSLTKTRADRVQTYKSDTPAQANVSQKLQGKVQKLQEQGNSSQASLDHVLHKLS